MPPNPPRNRIYAIVEGHGEANAPRDDPGSDPAVTVLLNRLLGQIGCWTLHAVKQPYRLRSGGDFFARTTLEDAIRTRREYGDCAAVVVLFDLDDGCPKDVAEALATRVRSMEPLPFSVVIVCAKREYEGWFLASLESIHPGRRYEEDPEARRDAKNWLGREFDYREARDQAAYTKRIDIEVATERSRSFRRLRHAMEEIIAASEAGQVVITPSQG